jgi:hypothetical protein
LSILLVSVSDKGSMSADQVLKTSIPAQTEIDTEERVQYEPFTLFGRKLSALQKIKRIIFLVSAAAAIGYYLFLIMLLILH